MGYHGIPVVQNVDPPQARWTVFVSSVNGDFILSSSRDLFTISHLTTL